MSSSRSAKSKAEEAVSSVSGGSTPRSLRSLLSSERSCSRHSSSKSLLEVGSSLLAAKVATQCTDTGCPSPPRTRLAPSRFKSQPQTLSPATCGSRHADWGRKEHGSTSFSWYEASNPRWRGDALPSLHPAAKVNQLLAFLQAYAAAPPPPEAAARLSETLAVERRRAQPPPRKQLKTSAPPESQCSAMAVDGEARGAVHSGAPRACICVLQGPSGSGKRWLLMSLADSLGMRPLVICLRDEWEEQRLLQQILPPHLITHPGVCLIKLRAPTETQVLRLLQQLQEQTAADLRGEGLAAAAARVAAADVAAIAAASKGDLRQALGSLRLAAVTPAAACLETGEAPAAIAAWLRTTTRRGESRETRAADRSSSAARKKTAATAAAAGILAAAMWCKDAQLASFHVIDCAATDAAFLDEDLEDLLAAVDEDEQMHEEQRQMDCVYAAAAAAIEAAAAAPLSAAHLHAPATAASRLPLHYRLREERGGTAAAPAIAPASHSIVLLSAACVALAHSVLILLQMDGFGQRKTRSAAAAADRQQQPRQLSFSMLQRKETRPPLYFVPSAVLQQMTLDPETFVQLLHANYPPFFEDIEDAAAAAAAFATMDAAAAFSVAHRLQSRTAAVGSSSAASVVSEGRGPLEQEAYGAPRPHGRRGCQQYPGGPPPPPGKYSASDAAHWRKLPPFRGEERGLFEPLPREAPWKERCTT
ncbi:hypothetical protein cyc_08767 [Cyclospora cayetanensis]|uniref:ATPase dynein-related AAA domain-containing protein n=1 Tax=Cyclospora cayetanensis TaxID=88456 RepID=A0A1D3CYG3_9EIME|nr:hypothetical protein cyc_08767 [Cyclospora cayetanensis]